MNLLPVFATGLLAGGLSCAAVQGGLLAGLVMRQRAATAGTAVRQPGTPPARRTTAGRTAAGRATTGRAERPGHTGNAPAGGGDRRRSGVLDDLLPVGGFLAGKLVSHTVLGALLGAVGGAISLSVGMRTTAQLAAGILIISFGLAQLGVAGFNRLVIEPPASWTRFVRGRARSASVSAPTALGLVSILIPCGVTLSVEALALASGSAWAGAATMAAFVLGTSPLFAVLGYLARRAGTLWRGRLRAATGIMVVLLGLYTFNAGLELAGSPLSASHLAERFSGVAAATETALDGTRVVTVDASGTQVVTVTARTGGYSPGNIRVRPGLSTRLVVHSDNAEGCVRAFVIPDTGGQWVLPVNGETSIDLGVLRPGRLDYSCGMGMYTGRLTVG